MAVQFCYAAPILNSFVMADMNKDNMKTWLKVLLMLFLIACAIIPNVGIWNARTIPEAREVISGFVVFWSVVNFIAEGVGLYFFSKKILFKKEEQGGQTKN